MSRDAMGRELALPGQTYEDFLKKTNDIAYMRHHLSALEEEVTMAEAERLKRIVVDGQTAFDELAVLLGSNDAAYRFLKGGYEWEPPRQRPQQQQQQQQQQHRRQQQQVPVNQAYPQGARHPVASTSRIQELPSQPVNQGSRVSQQPSQANPYSVPRTPHGWHANMPTASLANPVAAPPLPHRNVGAPRPHTGQEIPVQLAGPANNSTASSYSAAVPSVVNSSVNSTTSSTPNASIPDSSMLNTVTMRVRSTGKSEVYGGYTIANSVNGITLSNSDKVYRIPPFNEAPAPHASISDRYRVKEVTNGGDSLHALSPNTPGLQEAISRVHKSGAQELFKGYTIAMDENSDIIITKDGYSYRAVFKTGFPPSSVTSRTPQPLPQTVSPAALDARSSHDLSQNNSTLTSVTNGHVDSDARPSRQSQNPIPDPSAYFRAPQISNSTPLSRPLVSPASSLPTIQPVPAITNPSPIASQPVPSTAERVSQRALSDPCPPSMSLDIPPALRSSSATSDSPSRLARPPEKKTLAQDVMRALGKKRAREDTGSSESDTPANKKYTPNKPDLSAESVNKNSTPLSSEPFQSTARWRVSSAATTDTAGRSASPSVVANTATSNPLATAITHSFSHYRPAVLAQSLNRSSTPSSLKASGSATSMTVPTAAAMTDSARRSGTPSTVAQPPISNPLATAITPFFSQYQPANQSFISTGVPQAGTPSQSAGSQLNWVNVPVSQYSRLVTQQPQPLAQQPQLVAQVTQQPPQQKSLEAQYYKPFYAAPVQAQQPKVSRPTSVSTMTPPPAKNQDAAPLFLDSPDSPLPSYADSTQRRATPSAKALGKRKLVGVMLPPPPQWVRDDQERRRRRKTKEKEKVNELDKEGVKKLTKLAVHGALSMSSGDADEENALEIVQTRLRTMNCKWGKCDGILNSAERAYRHLLIHGEASDGTFMCHWDGCGAKIKSFSKWQVHAASHTLQPIFCAYESCEESYKDALSYINHSLERHRNDKLRLSSNPVMPVGSVDLANIPSSLPSYRSVPRSISQYPISAERHATLGVWVLKNITGDVDLPDKRKELPTGAELRERHKYDYLDEVARPSINSSKGVQFRKMDDLDTGLATRLFHEGLVLWPGQAMLREEEERVKKEEAEAQVKIEKEPIGEDARTREAVLHPDDGVGSSRAFPMVIE